MRWIIQVLETMWSQLLPVLWKVYRAKRISRLIDLQKINWQVIIRKWEKQTFPCSGLLILWIFLFCCSKRNIFQLVLRKIHSLIYCNIFELRCALLFHHHLFISTTLYLHNIVNGNMHKLVFYFITIQKIQQTFSLHLDGNVTTYLLNSLKI